MTLSIHIANIMQYECKKCGYPKDCSSQITPVPSRKRALNKELEIWPTKA
jgi:hypothetical protein